MTSFLDKIIDMRDRLMRPANGFNAGDTNQGEKLPIMPEWFMNTPYGQPRGVNIYELRQFAASPWIQMVHNVFRKRFLTTPIDFVNTDPEDMNDYAEERKKYMDFIQRVNSNNETLVETLMPVVADLAEIDAGVLVKRYSDESYAMQPVDLVNEKGETIETRTMRVLKPLGQRELVELWYADGATFTKQVDVYRRIMGYFQFSWRYPLNNPQFFQREEICYMSMGQNSYRLYGFSPLQTLQQVVEVLIQATRWNKDFYKNNAIPDGIVGLEGVSKEDIDRIKKMWQAEFKGKPHKLFIHNGKVNWNAMLSNARDMEWLNGQQWYMHLCFAVYGMSPSEVGFTQAVNGKNVQDGQQQNTANNAIEPWFRYVEQRLHVDIAPEIFQTEKPPIKLVFKFNDTAKQALDHNQAMDMLDRNVITVNEHRSKQGLDPVDWGDEPIAVRQQNVNEQTAQQDQQNQKQQESKNLEIPYTAAFEGFMRERVTHDN